MMEQARVRNLENSDAVAELMYERYSRGSTSLRSLAETYVAEMAESDRRWEEENSEFRHPWAESGTYMAPADRAVDALSDMRRVLRVEGTWNVGTWGEAASKFVDRIQADLARNSIGGGI